jgi:hypothetical protein
MDCSWGELITSRRCKALDHGWVSLVLRGQHKLKGRGYLNARNQPNVTPLWEGLASATQEQVITTGGKSSGD